MGATGTELGVSRKSALHYRDYKYRIEKYYTKFKYIFNKCSWKKVLKVSKNKFNGD